MDIKQLDSSKMKCFLECPRKFYWRYVRHLVPEEQHPALDFGKAIHEALYTWYDREPDEDPKEVQEYAIRVFHSNWTDVPGDDKRTHKKGQALLTKYFEKYPKEPFEFITPPETSFRIRLLDYFLIGRFDGLIKHQNMIMPLDHKTATRKGKYYYRRFRPDLQMSTYCWAGRKIAQAKGYDVPVKGAYINVLYFTKTKIDFDREIITRKDWEIEQFLEVAVKIMDNINLRDTENIKDWDPNWTSCQKWGTCKYRPLCLELDPEPLVPFMYKKEIWDPTDGNPTVEVM